MKRKALQYTVLLVLQLSSCIDAQRLYWIAAPNTIRPSSPYDVSVTFEGPNQTDPCRLKVAIKNSNDTINEQLVEVYSRSTKQALFEVGKIPKDAYTLAVKSISGCDINEKVSIKFNAKSFSILIQTDKSLYTPGDLVRYRVLTIDQDTKPVSVKKGLTIEIFDEKDRKIHQMKGVSTPKGVFVDTLQLASSTVLGKWKIFVTNEYESANKTFEVADYTLPTLFVTLSAPAFVLYTEKLPITVNAKYTFGVGAKGVHRIHVQDLKKPDVYEISTMFVIDGRKTVEFDMNTMGFADKRDGRILKITSELVEDVTVEQYESVETFVKLYQYEHAIEIVPSKVHFYTGLPFSIAVTVKTHDGTSIMDVNGNVKISIKYDLDRENSFYNEYQLDNHGRVQFFHTVPQNVSTISINAKYMDSDVTFNMTKPVNDGNHHISVALKERRNNIDKLVHIEVEATEEINYLNYHVVRRGQILQSNTVSFDTKSINQKFSFMATFLMFPKSTLLVFYARSNLEIVTDSVDVKFGETMKNYVDLRLSKYYVEPRDNVTLTVFSTIDSYVGLLGVDSSVKLLKNENDISSKLISEEQATYRDNFALDLTGKEAFSYKQMLATGIVVLTNCQKKPVSRDARTMTPFMVSIDSNESEDDEFDAFFTTLVRKNFPETWIWHDFIQTSDAGYQVPLSVVPDTITSWHISAFALHPAFGLALTRKPTELTVFQPFFIKASIPYSVKLGEYVEIPVQVFNYLDMQLDVTVQVFCDDCTFMDGEIAGEASVQTVHVPIESSVLVTFYVMPKTIGVMQFEIGATSAFAGDLIVKHLNVRAEGVPAKTYKTVIMDLKYQTSGATSLNITVPSDAVLNSTKIEITISGDVIGPILLQLNNLIRQPTVSGEKQMENFVPNIVLLDYLTATEQLTPAIEQKAKEHLKIGYQDQLNFLHDDGSFSVFGKNDRKGSVWVTTYISKSLIDASKYTPIDEAIILKALNWLCMHQQPDGRFVEIGFMYYSEMQSSVNGGAALTAYTLVTLLQYPDKTEIIDRAIEKATEFLRRDMTTINIYTLSLVTYALALKNDSLKETAVSLLDAKVSTTRTGLKYWSKSKGTPDSVSVEMTGYALLAYVALGREDEAEPIFKWMMRQRKRDGGFSSYQDTLIGIEALAKLASKLYSKTPLLEIAVTHGDEKKPETFTINHQNSLQPIIYELPPNTNNVGLSAQGSGLAIFDVATEYTTYEVDDSAAFDLVVTVVSRIPVKHLVLNVCASFKATAYAALSNTASIEVTFPSGYTFNHASKPALERIARLVEVKEKNTVVVLHFASFGRKTTCFDIDANQTTIVRRQKPAYATISDNYDSARTNHAFYSLI